MAVSATQQRARLAFDQSRRSPSPATPSADGERPSPKAPADQGTALRLARSLATGQRNKQASLDNQLVGEAGARVGQIAGAYFGGVGSVVGKRVGRVAGENWKIVLLLTLLWIVVPYLLLIAGTVMILLAVTYYFS